MHGARIPPHWAQPVAVHMAPDDGPRILWQCAHPSVSDRPADTLSPPSSSSAPGGDGLETPVEEVGAGGSWQGGGCGAGGAGAASSVSLSSAAAFDAVRSASKHGRLVASLAAARRVLGGLRHGGGEAGGARVGARAEDGAVSQEGERARHGREQVWRMRLRRLGAQDVAVVAARWAFEAATAEQVKAVNVPVNIPGT